MNQVADLLAQSRAAHDAYRMALSRFDPKTGQTVPGNPEVAAGHLARAFELRAEAESADVPGDSLIWKEEARTHPHYRLLKFYDETESKFRDEVTAPLVRPPIVGARG